VGIFARTFGLEALSTTPVDAPLGDYSANVTPPSRARAGLTLSDALGIPAVYRAIQIIAGIGAQLTLEDWKNGERVDPAPALITKPDPWRELSSWIERVLVCLAVDGNAFLLKSTGPDNTVAAAQVLDPFLTRVQRNPRTGAKEYVTYDPTRRKTVTYTAAQVEHVWLIELPGHDRGLSPIQAHRLTLTGQLDTRDYGDQWFQHNDVPSGVLSSDQTLDPASIAMYRKVWHDPSSYDATTGETTTRNLGQRVRVLGKGLSYTPIMLKPEDAQWIETRKLGVLEVALMFGLPANYLHAAVEGSSLTYSNLEMIDSQFLRLTLFPNYLRKIEAALTALLPRGHVVRFNPDALLRPDAKTRAEIDKTYIDAGVYDAAYVRKRDRIDAPAPAPKPADSTPTQEQETPA
jgi:HK97 family phage portal protein